MVQSSSIVYFNRVVGTTIGYALCLQDADTKALLGYEINKFFIENK